MYRDVGDEINKFSILRMIWDLKQEQHAANDARGKDEDATEHSTVRLGKRLVFPVAISSVGDRPRLAGV